MTRQKLPVFGGEAAGLASADNLRRGAYVLAEAPDGAPALILIASGSEVAATLEAWRKLTEDGIAARLVSMPSWELFEEQDEEYRNSVLPPGIGARLAIEAGCSFGWWRWVGDHGDVIGIDRYGASAPGPTNMEKFGFTPENIEARARALLAR